MALRVTQGMMYSAFDNNINTSLNRMMEISAQQSSQKRINKPSDDPVGAGRAIMYTASIDRQKMYEDNINTAKGWLGTADGVLASSGSVMTVLTKIKELAQQGASGTYDKNNREQIAYELRQLFGQLLNLSNTQYNGKYIFSGHKSDQASYKEGLAVTCNDPAFANKTFHVEGGATKSIVLQTVSGATTDTASYRYSDDGGKTWKNATVDTTLNPPYLATQMRINAGGASIVLDKGVPVKPVDTSNANENNNGTWMYIRPTAIYQGDDHSTQVVTPYGTTTVNGKAEGSFSRDVAVRIDKVEGGKISFSFSIDDGKNWVAGTAPDDGANTRIPVPGGFLNLDATPTAGDQFIIHPRRANVDFMISDTDSITVNIIGKDIFGGLYQDPDTDKVPTVVPGSGNLFEAVGKLVAYAETNSQQGMQEALKDLQDVMQRVTTQAAIVGGRENRLEVTASALAMRMFDEQVNLSALEDADIIQLARKQEQYNQAFTSVLKSSSMIMQLSLINYL